MFEKPHVCLKSQPGHREIETYIRPLATKSWQRAVGRKPLYFYVHVFVFPEAEVVWLILFSRGQVGQVFVVMRQPQIQVLVRKHDNNVRRNQIDVICGYVGFDFGKLWGLTGSGAGSGAGPSADNGGVDDRAGNVADPSADNGIGNSCPRAGLGLGLFETKDKCGFKNKYVRNVVQLFLPDRLGLGLLGAIDLDST